MASIFTGYCSRFLNIIYPKRCLLCGTDLPHNDRLYACPTCWDSRETIGPLACTACALPLEYGGERCPSCTGKKLPYRAAYASVRYRGVIQKYCHRIKFGRRAYLIDPLAELMCRTVREKNLCQCADAILPVPLHPARYRERGFNQSELLSRIIGGRFSVPVRTDILFRKKNTHPQFELSQERRLTNIRNAFEIHTPCARPLPKRVLLVDDICTTGGTFRECASTLKKAGVKDITCLALARD